MRTQSRAQGPTGIAHPDLPMDTTLFLDIYRSMATARALDLLEASLAQRGEAFFYVPCAGHEADASLAPHLTEHDWLHAHYRDRALLLARGIPAKSFFDTLFGNVASSSAGRRMPGFMSDPSLHVLSGSTPTGNNALQAVGVAAAVKDREGDPIVLCCVGDGTTQQGEFMEAVAEAVRSQLPVLFMVHDNRYALSTPTRGKTCYSLPQGDADSFYGLDIVRVDGTDPVASYDQLGAVVDGMRADRQPRFVLLQVERLSSHTNADDETVYRDAEEIARAREIGDPVKNLADRLREAGVSAEEIAGIEKDVAEQVQQAMLASRREPQPEDCGTPKRPIPDDQAARPENQGTGEASLTMLQSLREVLRDRLAADPSVVVFGEDIEDPKGDVFGLTRGLSTDFPGRVFNSALTESTIVGTAIGRALAGERPVACIQFADFLPLAYNQLFSELGSMYWRTNGDWEAPVIVLAICGAYRPGLGPFHAQTPDATMAQIPGLDVYTPSSAADAAGLFQAAFASGRPSIILYPKSLINDRDRLGPADVANQWVPVGKALTLRAGTDLTLVTWGSTLPLCERAAEALQEANALVELIDLRTLSPWDRETVLASARKTGRLLVVHEDNQTCGLGGEVAATVAEALGDQVQVSRVARDDSYVAFHLGGQFAVLPTFRKIVTRAAEMLDYDLRWEEPVVEQAGRLIVNAIGSSPSDETLRITDILVKPGQTVAVGDLLLSGEAEKASMDISAPAAGVVENIQVAEGDTVDVGEPVLELRVDEDRGFDPITAELASRPILAKRLATTVDAVPETGRVSGEPVYLNAVCTKVGSRVMRNEDFLDNFPDWTSEDVMRRTGIEKRHWIGEDENVLTLATDATRQLLDQEGLSIGDIDTIICSTGTPLSAVTPSLACRILHALSPDKGEVLVQAYDINAACSGYLYALQAAYDTLKYDASRKILIVTAETLSPVVDRTDPQTAFIFGDAATASLLSCERRGGNMHARVHRPVLSALGEEEYVLRVPFPGSGEAINMEGTQVFRVAVRKMVDMLEKACLAEHVTIEELNMIVTHQANERIIEAARKMIKFPKERVFNQMRDFGNTSSNTIPLALQTVIPAQASGNKVGLTAFGGGFTFGAAVIEVL